MAHQAGHRPINTLTKADATVQIETQNAKIDIADNLPTLYVGDP